MSSHKKATETFYYKDGVLTKEHYYAPRIMRLLYASWFGRLVRPLITSGWVNRLIRVLYTSRLSARLIPRFIRRFSIPTDEIEKPLEHFTSFNDFFTRKLKKDSRPIDTRNQSITSPCDSKLLVIENLSETTTFYAKKHAFDCASFLESKELVSLFKGGTLFLFRLSVDDYHRFHFPCSGEISCTTQQGASFNSVQPLAYNTTNPLMKNHRISCVLSIPQQTKLFFSAVGSLAVGSVAMTYKPQRNYHIKGHEMGYFAFGGSLVVLLAPPNTLTVRSDILTHSRHGRETYVRVGEAVALHSP